MTSSHPRFMASSIDGQHMRKCYELVSWLTTCITVHLPTSRARKANEEVNVANKWHCPSFRQLGNDKAIFRVKNHQHQSKLELWGIALINDCLQSNFILLAQKITRNSWNLDLTLADGVLGRIRLRRDTTKNTSPTYYRYIIDRRPTFYRQPTVR